LPAELDMNVRTAESHHANIMAKLNVESLADIATHKLQVMPSRMARQITSTRWFCLLTFRLMSCSPGAGSTVHSGAFKQVTG
jgi:hypothetical protein